MGACDVCGRAITEPEGYLLTTREVVTSKPYWHRVVRGLGRLSGRSDFAMVVSEYVADMASSDTPWMVCRSCSTLFSFDRAARREKARIWRATGQPAGGFRLCSVTKRGRDSVVDVIDDEGFSLAQRVAFQALAELEGRIQPKQASQEPRHPGDMTRNGGADGRPRSGQPLQEGSWRQTGSGLWMPSQSTRRDAGKATTPRRRKWWQFWRW